MKPGAEIPRPAIAASDVTPERIEQWAVIAQRDGHALRAGKGNAIEGQAINPPFGWHRLPLPNDAVEFATASDRDQVLALLRNKINELDSQSTAQ